MQSSYSNAHPERLSLTLRRMFQKIVCVFCNSNKITYTTNHQTNQNNPKAQCKKIKCHWFLKKHKKPKNSCRILRNFRDSERYWKKNKLRVYTFSDFRPLKKYRKKQCSFDKKKNQTNRPLDSIHIIKWFLEMV